MSNVITIIGGSGFIGTRLCQRLYDSGENPFFIVDKIESKDFPEKVSIADVRKVTTLSDAISSDTKIIINLAAEHRDDVSPLSLYDDVNVLGAKNICEVAKEKGTPTIVFTSSVAVYGFAEVGTSEDGKINPFNDYGRTKYEAEQVFKAWQAEDPAKRTLVVIRPTVVFGERNRGNVYNLLRQIASGKFVMIGNGENRKSMAYVENVAAFLVFAAKFEPGIHIFNFIDKPDYSMNSLVSLVNKMLCRPKMSRIRLPFSLGCFLGKCVDGIAYLTGRKFAISAIRVKKFCSNSIYNTSIEKTGFTSPVNLEDALERTVRYEFLENTKPDHVFFSE